MGHTALTSSKTLSLTLKELILNSYLSWNDFFVISDLSSDNQENIHIFRQSLPKFVPAGQHDYHLDLQILSVTKGMLLCLSLAFIVNMFQTLIKKHNGIPSLLFYR